MFDPCLSGGFAENGDIYFSSCPFGFNAGVYYYPAGTTAFSNKPEVVTKNFKFLPFYIDITPDSSQILIAGLPSLGTKGYSCKYNKMVYYNEQFYPGDCHYYYLNTFDGSADNLFGNIGDTTQNMKLGFVPTFFSPDGTKIIGSYYLEVDPTYYVNRNDLSTPLFLSYLTGVQEWSPIAFLPTPNPTTIPISTSATSTLPSTGANSNIVITLAVILMAIGASTLVKAKQNN
jgi:LPXTG-motif cell wall-anchored protein